MMESQRSDIEKYKLIKDGIKTGIDEISKQNKRLNAYIYPCKYVSLKSIHIYIYGQKKKLKKISIASNV